PLIRWAEKKTYLARQVLPKKISLRKMVKQLGGLVLLVAGITRGDPMLMGEGVNMDFVVEPARAKLIPRFKEVKKAALKAGAYGCSISGAGPSIFALTSPQVSNSVARAMARVLEEFSISYKLLITRFSREGARVEG
ncbi:MAG TPA: homoserine kinase, partial [Candidatus Methanomethylia archaeon]|nr:homoserine kinase [Candidatus Methanomethylicia archaeon]